MLAVLFRLAEPEGVTVSVEIVVGCMEIAVGCHKYAYGRVDPILQPHLVIL